MLVLLDVAALQGHIAAFPALRSPPFDEALQIPLSVFFTQQDKVETAQPGNADAAAQLEEEAMPIVKKPRGRAPKKPKSSSTGSNAAAATRALANAAEMEATKAERDWQKAQKAFQQKV